MRSRPEFAFFALALICVAAIALPFLRCGGSDGGSEEAAAREERRLADPEEVAGEFVRRYYTYAGAGDFEAWRRRVLPLTTDPARARLLERQSEPEMEVYDVQLQVLTVKTTSVRQAGDQAAVAMKVRLRAVPRKPGGEWSATREAEREVVLYLRKEGGEWLVWRGDLL